MIRLKKQKKHISFSSFCSYSSSSFFFFISSHSSLHVFERLTYSKIDKYKSTFVFSIKSNPSISNFSFLWSIFSSRAFKFPKGFVSTHRYSKSPLASWKFNGCIEKGSRVSRVVLRPMTIPPSVSSRTTINLCSYLSNMTRASWTSK